MERFEFWFSMYSKRRICRLLAKSHSERKLPLSERLGPVCFLSSFSFFFFDFTLTCESVDSWRRIQFGKWSGLRWHRTRFADSYHCCYVELSTRNLWVKEKKKKKVKILQITFFFFFFVQTKFGVSLFSSFFLRTITSETVFGLRVDYSQRIAQ